MRPPHSTGGLQRTAYAPRAAAGVHSRRGSRGGGRCCGARSRAMLGACRDVGGPAPPPTAAAALGGGAAGLGCVEMLSGAALLALAALLCAVPPPGLRGAAVAAAAAAWTAWLNVSWENGGNRNRSGWEAGESGLYGLDSPLQSAEGLLVLPDSPDTFNACSAHTNFSGAPPAGGSPGWLALIQRGGGCSFADKIRLAAERGAAAAVIYNYRGTGNEVLPMSHHGAEKIVAIMIGNLKGMEILHRIQSGMKVTMVIEVGKKHSLSVNIFTILFISVSFFVVAAATVGCYVSYSARRLIIARAQSREQETGPDGDSCVVCFEQYKPNDVMRVLTCNHVFHKTCIDPWLLEHGTCPLCKCDILKVLGVEMDVEPRSEPVQAPGSSGQRPLSTVTIVNEEDNLSETASSGYDSVQGPDESAQEAHTPLENHNMHPTSDESQLSTVTVLSHGDNPSFEGDDTQVCEGRIVCEVTF
ncbi:E3 ubiquitin-protein ligase RNF128 isoform X2 [Poecile atricapillus]|uniref:E3 ubiquitin-protein ligase RNF128 isoform X2 n=1 Tax=Poecile atricapillus TaxID=48891 RepID=UPI0027399AA3|nr:E3 ubiquitin-protein ligase RNF128 isoform X2 [Poecile atricapillus]